MGQKGILQCSFAPNRFKISQEITELWLLLPGMLSDSIEKRNGQRIIICCSFVLKWSKKRSKSGWVMTIFSLRGWVIPVRTIWVKRGSLCVHLYRKDPILPQRGWVIPMRSTLDKSGSLGVNLYQNDLISVKKYPRYGIIPLEVAWFHCELHGAKRDHI